MNTPNNIAYRKIELKSNMLISDDNKNRWLMLNDIDQTIVRFKCAFKSGNKYVFRGYRLDKGLKQNFFTRPFISAHLNIFLYDSIGVRAIIRILLTLNQNLFVCRTKISLSSCHYFTHCYNIRKTFKPFTMAIITVLVMIK